MAVISSTSVSLADGKGKSRRVKYCSRDELSVNHETVLFQMTLWGVFAGRTSSADPWARSFFGTPSIPREAALTRLARIGNKVSVEISYGGFSHKIGWINHVVGESVDANGLVESGGETERQGKLSPRTGMLLLTPFLWRGGGSSCLRSLPTIFDAVVVVWARFAVERRAALRKLILPAISSCLHWFGLSENPEERFQSQLHIRRTKTHPAPIGLPPLSRAARAAPLPLHVSIDYWKGTHWKFIWSRTHLRLESSDLPPSIHPLSSSPRFYNRNICGHVDISICVSRIGFNCNEKHSDAWLNSKNK